MRLLVEISADKWDLLRALARDQYRDPRKQLELIVHKALAEALEAERSQESALRKEERCGADTHVEYSHAAAK